ncbi:hypothetical protein D3C87_111780 [compost metagenome]
MKKAMMIGIVALATSVSFTTAMAAPGAAAKAPREMLSDYSKTMKEYFNKIGANKGITTQNRAQIEKMLETDLELSGAAKTALMSSLTGSSKEVLAVRIESLATIIAAKKMSADLAKVDAVEATSIEAAVKASAKLIANANMIGAVKEVKTLNKEELTLVRDALAKLESLPTDILIKFSKTERDSYTEILNRHDQLAETGTKGSAEEAFIQAIMDVKKVDKTKALEIARKLKECA